MSTRTFSTEMRGEDAGHSRGTEQEAWPWP
jgi:hypothetical protein